MSITYEEAVADRKKVKQQYTRNATTLNSYIFAQLSKKDVITLHAEMQVIAEEVLAANAIVIEVATEDALVKAERWNADFEADHKAISDRVFEYIAPPVPNHSSTQFSTGSVTEENQEINRFSEIPQTPTRTARTSDDRRTDSPIKDSPHASVLHHVGNYPTLNPVEDRKPHHSESRQSMLIRRLPKTQIQPFDGNPMNWPLFSNVFQTSVHNVLEHDSDRLTILKELLNPSVRQTIARFLFNPSLYSKVWETLERNYGNPTLIIEAAYAAIDALPFWKDYGYTGLRRFSSELNGILANLEMVGGDLEIASSENLRRLVVKMPPRLTDE